jgi:phosphatidylserine/phosphatidylglycerophosphate/cardiolipin synthase-like enzyme
MATATSLSTVTVQTQGSPNLVEYCFSTGYGSKGNCASVVVKYIAQGKTSIHVLIYSLTLSDVRDALIAAKQRGVDVKMVMDHTQATIDQGSQYGNLVNASVSVRLHKGAYQMHDKVAIIDGHIILTGSFNWTNDANSNNDENLAVLDSQTWATAYDQQFQAIWNASA